MSVARNADLTLYKLAEEESGRRFRLMIDNVTEYAILSLDADGKVVSWNKGAQAMKGYAKDEIIGRNFVCFYTPEDIAAGRPWQVLELARAEGHCQEEGWRIRKNGSRFFANVLVTAVRDPDGVAIGYIKITRDLTDQRALGKVLAESNRLREAIMTAAPYSIVATDAQGLITSVNPAAERMLWYTSEELVGKVNLESFHDPIELATAEARMTDRVGMAGDSAFEAIVHETRDGRTQQSEWGYIRSDGSRVPVQVAVTALRGDSHEIVGFLSTAYDVTDRKLREEYINHIAHHDQLTGLPTRELLHDRLDVSLARAVREKTKVGVLMIDLDFFKRVNDSLGHHIGDQLLKVSSTRIASAVRSSDTVARMGGDEFVVILPDLSDVREADRIAEKIMKAISEPADLSGHRVVVTPSIGVSCYPDDGVDESALLKNADAAMYSAKDAGRHCYRHFSIEMARAESRKRALEEALRGALSNHTLEVHYQPQVELKTGRIVGVEALVRWNDPQHGKVSPQIFIPIAEESGLIVPIGEWVLRTACRDALTLQKCAGYPLAISVNISARQLSDIGKRGTVVEIMKNIDLDPRMLELEITESALMDKSSETRSHLRMLRSLGVSVVMDDFGTGFSSLSYLTQFPINGLKIDQSFVHRMATSRADLSIVQAIAAMAQSLNLKITAEGVETDEQLRLLQSEVCEESHGSPDAPFKLCEHFRVQGFRLCEAMPLARLCKEFDRLTRSGKDMVEGSLR
ncbi:MAG: EAL domain-containing protein [Pseudomonadota bacterium]|nr:EAL domain-containing protein [Pseudomonadota bacterium]